MTWRCVSLCKKHVIACRLNEKKKKALGGYSDVCRAGLRVFWFDLNGEEEVTQKFGAGVYW